MGVYEKLYAANMNNAGEQLTDDEVHCVRDMIDRLEKENEQWRKDFAYMQNSYHSVRKENAELKELLRKVEWVYPCDGRPESLRYCPHCQEYVGYKVDGHKPDCRFAKALEVDGR